MGKQMIHDTAPLAGCEEVLEVVYRWRAPVSPAHYATRIFLIGRGAEAGNTLLAAVSDRPRNLQQ